jgi:hypothetical protein
VSASIGSAPSAMVIVPFNRVMGIRSQGEADDAMYNMTPSRTLILNIPNTAANATVEVHTNGADDNNNSELFEQVNFTVSYNASLKIVTISSNRLGRFKKNNTGYGNCSGQSNETIREGRCNAKIWTEIRVVTDPSTISAVPSCPVQGRNSRADSNFEILIPSMITFNLQPGLKTTYQTVEAPSRVVVGRMYVNLTYSFTYQCDGSNWVLVKYGTKH